MTNLSSSVADTKIAIIGLGYVGLPLAVAFGQKQQVVGFDISSSRIDELKSGHDRTRELTTEELSSASHLSLSSDVADTADCTVYIVTVPTPITAAKQPDLTPLLSASALIGGLLKKGDIVIYESTVYPGCTEEDCVPVLEAQSGLTYNVDFFCGYSPERINPGDKQHRVADIVKVTSGSTPDVADFVDALYQQIIVAGTHKAMNIRVAEAAKVIENTQRDVNIALINELSQLFSKLNIDTEAVLEAAGTKWNFLPFRPGLVGGHCIGVDPYYLTHKATQIGYEPRMILAGRQINDGMGRYVADQLLASLARKNIMPQQATILMLGLTFKENCPDIRNTRVVDVIESLQDAGCQVDIHDPWVDSNEVQAEYGFAMCDAPQEGHYDGVVIAVAHDQFKADHEEIQRFASPKGVIYDLKYVLPASSEMIRL